MIQGNSLVRLKKPVPALEAFQRILDIAPASDVAEQALFLMLKLQYDQKNYSAILTSYQYILRQLPQSLSKWRGLCYLTAGEAYIRLGRVEEAQAIYEMLLKVYANDQPSVYAQDGLAWCFELSGRHKEALEARQKLRICCRSIRPRPPSRPTTSASPTASTRRRTTPTRTRSTTSSRPITPDSPALAAALYRAGFALPPEILQPGDRGLAEALEKAPASRGGQGVLSNRRYPRLRAGVDEAAPPIKGYWRKIRRELFGPDGRLSLGPDRLLREPGRRAPEQVKSLLSNYPKADDGDALDFMEAVFRPGPEAGRAPFFFGLVEADPVLPRPASSSSASAGAFTSRRGTAGAAKELERFSVEYTGHPSLAKAQLLIGEC